MARDRSVLRNAASMWCGAAAREKGLGLRPARPRAPSPSPAVAVRLLPDPPGMHRGVDEPSVSCHGFTAPCPGACMHACVPRSASHARRPLSSRLQQAAVKVAAAAAATASERIRARPGGQSTRTEAASGQPQPERSVCETRRPRGIWLGPEATWLAWHPKKKVSKLTLCPPQFLTVNQNVPLADSLQ
jgi:hypothetical protein